MRGKSILGHLTSGKIPLRYYNTIYHIILHIVYNAYIIYCIALRYHSLHLSKSSVIYERKVNIGTPCEWEDTFLQTEEKTKKSMHPFSSDKYQDIFKVYPFFCDPLGLGYFRWLRIGFVASCVSQGMISEKGSNRLCGRKSVAWSLSAKASPDPSMQWKLIRNCFNSETLASDPSWRVLSHRKKHPK